MSIVKPVLVAAGTVSALAAAWVAYRRWRLHQSSMKSIPTPPEPSIFFGHFFALFGSRAGETHKDWILKHGDIVKYDLFLAGVRIVMSSPDAIRRVLVTNPSNYSKTGFIHGFLRRWIGHSLYFAEGETHKRHTKIVSEAFRFQNISKLSPQFSSQANKLVNRWLELLHNRPASSSGSPCFLEVDMKQATYDLALNILSMSGYGLHNNSDSNTDDQAELAAAYEGTMACSTATLANFLYHMWPFRLLPLPGVLHEQRARRRIQAVVEDLIGRRREALRAAAGDEAATARLEGDLLGLMLRSAAVSAADPGSPPPSLLSARSPGPRNGLSDEEVRDNMIAFLLLGHAPTAVCLCWTLYLLAKHPAAAARVREEAHRAGGGSGRPLTARDMEEMPFLTAVIKESLRLHPPAPMLGRAPLADDFLRGHTVKAQTPVLVPIMVLHRLPSLWNRPDEFVPRRFLPGSTIDKDREPHPYKWCPFLTGPRKCMASHFAQIQVGLAVATIVSRVNLEVPPGHPEPFGRHGEMLLNAHPYVRLRVSPLPTGPCAAAPADAAGAGPAMTCNGPGAE